MRTRPEAQSVGRGLAAPAGQDVAQGPFGGRDRTPDRGGAAEGERMGAAVPPCGVHRDEARGMLPPRMAERRHGEGHNTVRPEQDEGQARRQARDDASPQGAEAASPPNPGEDALGAAHAGDRGPLRGVAEERPACRRQVLRGGGHRDADMRRGAEAQGQPCVVPLHQALVRVLHGERGDAARGREVDGGTRDREHDAALLPCGRGAPAQGRLGRPGLRRLGELRVAAGEGGPKAGGREARGACGRASHRSRVAGGVRRGEAGDTGIHMKGFRQCGEST